MCVDAALFAGLKRRSFAWVRSRRGWDMTPHVGFLRELPVTFDVGAGNSGMSRGCDVER